jgi:hypothetical protein
VTTLYLEKANDGADAPYVFSVEPTFYGEPLEFDPDVADWIMDVQVSWNDLQTTVKTALPNGFGAVVKALETVF